MWNGFKRSSPWSVPHFMASVLLKLFPFTNLWIKPVVYGLMMLFLCIVVFILVNTSSWFDVVIRPFPESTHYWLLLSPRVFISRAIPWEEVIGKDSKNWGILSSLLLFESSNEAAEQTIHLKYNYLHHCNHHPWEYI